MIPMGRNWKAKNTQGFPLLFLQLESQVRACIRAVLAAGQTKKLKQHLMSCLLLKMTIKQRVEKGGLIPLLLGCGLKRKAHLPTPQDYEEVYLLPCQPKQSEMI